MQLWETAPCFEGVTPHADWDSVASMILALRLHAFEHGTIPVWNYMLCGGRPELAIPFSWAWTWPSVFAYLLPPLAAIVAVWIGLSAVGFAATRALLLRWTGSRSGALTGAGLYVLSGYFATRFNAGHVSFAFYHLVPLLMLAFERSLEREARGQAGVAALLGVAAASFAFATAGLPHALLHFYPAFALLVLFRVAQAARRSGLRASLAAAAAPLAFHGLGLWLAAYKVWPAIRWHLGAPRQGVKLESYGLARVLENTLSSADPLAASAPAWQVYSPWEYDAYTGPAAWGLAALALGVALAGVARRRTRALPAVVPLACAWLALGLALALGNDHPLAPGAWFRHLPLLEGVRSFHRYQILVVFALAALAAEGMAVLARLAARLGGGLRAAATALVALAVLAPVALHAFFLVRDVPVRSNASLLAGYELSAGEVPSQIRKPRVRRRESDHESSLLEAGHWIANCRSDLTPLGTRPRFRDTATPLSQPPPARIEALGAARLVLRYPEALSGPVLLQLRVLPEFRFEPPLLRRADGVEFDAGELREGRLAIHASYPGPAEGALASLAGGVALACAVAVRARRTHQANAPRLTAGGPTQRR
jgi:hypothetical protein